MTSLLCVKNLEGKVKVHNKDKAASLADPDAIIRSSAPKSSEDKNIPGQVKRPMSTPNMPTGDQATPGMDAGCLINNTMRMQTWISKKQVKDLQDVNEFLQHTDSLELRKKELLHKNWNDRVYEPIRQRILEAMNGQDCEDKGRRRRELHHQYLEHVNRKGHVFLDTMDKGEYYAQALYSHRPAPITVRTETLNDPLLAQGRKRSQEDQTILRCTTGQIYSYDDITQVKLPPLPLVPLGRHGTNSITWLEMPLGNIESTPRKASRSKHRKRHQNTNLHPCLHCT